MDPFQLVQMNNAWSAQQAQKQMDFQERMSNTAHQREIADLKAAGLNPVLSAKLGGASTPSGAKAEPDTSGTSEIIRMMSGAVSAAGSAARAAENATELNLPPFLADYKNQGWYIALPKSVQKVVDGMMTEFSRGYTDGYNATMERAAQSGKSTAAGYNNSGWTNNERYGDTWFRQQYNQNYQNAGAPGVSKVTTSHTSGKFGSRRR